MGSRTEVIKSQDNAGKIIDGDAEPAVETVEIAPVEAKKPVEAKSDFEADIAKLKKQLEDEKNGRREAERRENEARNLANRANSDKNDSEFKMIETAIETVKANLTTYKAQYADALRAGDVDRAAEINEAIALSASQKLQLENGKQAMVEKAKAPPARSADPVEALASQLTPRSAAWVRAHPEYASGQSYQRMVAAHNLAVAEGIPVDTSDYFASVEETLKIGKKAPIVEEEEGESPFSEASRPSRTAPPATPVTRGTGNSSRTIRLTPEQAEIAEMNKMSPKEYWEQLERVKSERAQGLH